MLCYWRMEWNVRTDCKRRIPFSLSVSLSCPLILCTSAYGSLNRTTMGQYCRFDSENKRTTIIFLRCLLNKSSRAQHVAVVLIWLAQVWLMMSLECCHLPDINRANIDCFSLYVLFISIGKIFYLSIRCSFLSITFGLFHFYAKPNLKNKLDFHKFLLWQWCSMTLYPVIKLTRKRKKNYHK